MNLKNIFDIEAQANILINMLRGINKFDEVKIISDMLNKLSAEYLISQYASTKNKQVTAVEDGKKYWISRSCAVAAFVFIVDSQQQTYILANKRGQGTPDFQGYWNCPCGYIDWDESAPHAVCREIFEETGFVFTPNDFKLAGVNSEPTENKQNITLRYYTVVSVPSLYQMPRSGGENDEVAEIQLIPLSDLSKYQWAFNHDEIIKNISNEFSI